MPGPSPLPSGVGVARAYPVRLSLEVPAVVGAGLGALLRPLGDRVEVLGATERRRAHVEVFDPEDHPFPPLAGLPRVALTWDVSPRAAARARCLGAVRVLPLSVAVGDLVHAVEQVHRGRGAETVPPEDVERLPTSADAVLSPREVDVVRGICRGLSNLEIAEDLLLSINSVKTYVRTAYRKMGVVSRSQAVLWGVEHGL